VYVVVFHAYCRAAHKIFSIFSCQWTALVAVSETVREALIMSVVEPVLHCSSNMLIESVNVQCRRLQHVMPQPSVYMERCLTGLYCRSIQHCYPSMAADQTRQDRWLHFQLLTDACLCRPNSSGCSLLYNCLFHSIFQLSCVENMYVLLSF